MKSSYEKNMKKFAVYADRNIFIASKEQNTAASVDKNELIKDELRVVCDEVEALKSVYLAKRADHLQLAGECRDGDLLLKDMRKSLFTIRVGGQLFDDCKVQPLIETVAILEQHQGDMVKLSERAKGNLFLPVTIRDYIPWNVWLKIHFQSAPPISD